MQNKYGFPLYHWHFEVSGKCTLKCPRCPRNDMARVPWFNKELSLDFFKKTLTPDLLKNEVKRITMCGDIGDPIYASEYLEIIDYIKTHKDKIHVHTITNGSYKKAEWWRNFAKISNEYDTINFSVDGFDHASNILYRVGSEWDSIMQGMDIMCKQSSAFVRWAAIVFSFNQNHLDRITKQATDIGCDSIQFTNSTKFGSKYGSSYGGSTDPLEPRAEFISKSHRYERYVKNLSGRVQPSRDYLDHTTKMYNDISPRYQTMITPACLIGDRGMYVSADGVLHPCVWISFPYVALSTDRKTIKFEDSFHQTHREKLSLVNRTLEEVLNDDIWDPLFKSFNDKKSAWVECELKCSCSAVSNAVIV